MTDLLQAQAQHAGFRFALLDPARLPRSEDALTEEERELVASRPWAPARRAQWIRGRAALRWLAPELGSVLDHDDGAPRPANDNWVVSLSHAGDHVAAVVLPRSHDSARVAIDLVALAETSALSRVLDRLDLVIEGAVSPARVWSALECTLKLRRLPVERLLGGALRVELAAGAGTEGAVRVHGLGLSAEIRFVDRARHLIGIGCEP